MGVTWTEEMGRTLLSWVGQTSATAIAAKIGVEVGEVKSRVAHLGLSSKRRLTAKQIEELKRMNGYGYHAVAIALALGCSRASVYAWFRKLGLRENRKRHVLVTAEEIAEDEPEPFIENPIPVYELMRPCKYPPGHPIRVEVERQRELRGIQNHAMDAESWRYP